MASALNPEAAAQSSVSSARSREVRRNGEAYATAKQAVRERNAQYGFFRGMAVGFFEPISTLRLNHRVDRVMRENGISVSSVALAQAVREGDQAGLQTAITEARSKESQEEQALRTLAQEKSQTDPRYRIFDEEGPVGDELRDMLGKSARRRIRVGERRRIERDLRELASANPNSEAAKYLQGASDAEIRQLARDVQELGRQVRHGESGLSSLDLAIASITSGDRRLQKFAHTQLAYVVGKYIRLAAIPVAIGFAVTNPFTAAPAIATLAFSAGMAFWSRHRESTIGREIYQRNLARDTHRATLARQRETGTNGQRVLKGVGWLLGGNFDVEQDKYNASRVSGEVLLRGDKEAGRRGLEELLEIPEEEWSDADASAALLLVAEVDRRLELSLNENVQTIDFGSDRAEFMQSWLARRGELTARLQRRHGDRFNGYYTAATRTVDAQIFTDRQARDRAFQRRLVIESVHSAGVSTAIAFAFGASAHSDNIGDWLTGAHHDTLQQMAQGASHVPHPETSTLGQMTQNLSHNTDIQTLGRDLGNLGARPLDFDQVASVAGSVSKVAEDALQAGAHSVEGTLQHAAQVNVGRVEGLAQTVQNIIKHPGEILQHTSSPEHPYPPAEMDASKTYYILHSVDGKHNVELPIKEFRDQGLQLVQTKHGVALASMSDPLRIYGFDLHPDSADVFTGPNAHVALDMHWAVPMDKINPNIDGQYHQLLSIKGDIQLGHATEVNGHWQFNFNSPAEAIKGGWLHDAHGYQNMDQYLHSLSHIVQDPRLPFAMELNSKTDFVIPDNSNYGLFVDSATHQVYAAIDINPSNVHNLVDHLTTSLNKPNVPNIGEVNIHYAHGGNITLENFRDADVKAHMTSGTWTAHAISTSDGFAADYATRVGTITNGVTHYNQIFPGGQHTEYTYMQDTAPHLNQGISGLNPNEVDGLQHVMNFTNLDNLPHVITTPGPGDFLGAAGDHWPILAAGAYFAAGGLTGFVRERQGKKAWPATWKGRAVASALSLGYFPGFGFSRVIHHKKSGAGGAGAGTPHTGGTAGAGAGGAGTPVAGAGGAPTGNLGGTLYTAATPQPLVANHSALQAVPANPKGKQVGRAQTQAEKVAHNIGGGVTGAQVQVARNIGQRAADAGGVTPLERARHAAVAMEGVPDADRLDLSVRQNAEMLAAAIPGISTAEIPLAADHIQRTFHARQGIQAYDKAHPQGGFPPPDQKERALAGLTAMRDHEHEIAALPAGSTALNTPIVALREAAVLQQELGGGQEPSIRQAFEKATYSPESRAVVAAHLHTPAATNPDQQAQERVQAAFQEVGLFANPASVDKAAVASVASALEATFRSTGQLGTSYVQSRNNILHGLDAFPLTVPLRARLIATLPPRGVPGTTTDQDRIAAAVEYWRTAGPLTGTPPTPTPLPQSEIPGITAELVSMGLRQGDIDRQFNAIRGTVGAADKAVQETLRPSTEPNAKRIETGLRTINADPVTNPNYAKEMAQAIRDIRSGLSGVTNEEIRDAVNALNLEPDVRARIAHEVFESEVASFGASPTAAQVEGAAKLAIASAGIPPQTAGQPIDAKVAQTIDAVATLLLRYNGGTPSAPTGTTPAQKIPDIPKLLRDTLGLKPEHITEIAKESVRGLSTLSREAVLDDLLHTIIDPASSVEDIAAIIKEVAPLLPTGGGSAASLDTVLTGAGIPADSANLQKRAAIYGRFIQPSGAATAAGETVTGLLTGTSSAQDEVAVVRGLLMAEQPEGDIVAAMSARPAAGRSASVANIATAAVRVGTTPEEKAKLAVLAAAPRDYAEAKDVTAVLESQVPPISTDIIREQMRLVNLSLADRGTIVVDSLTDNIPNVTRYIATGSGSAKSRKSMVEDVRTYVKQALAVAGYPDFTAVNTARPAVVAKLRDVLTANFAALGIPEDPTNPGTPDPTFINKLVDDALTGVN